MFPWPSRPAYCSTILRHKYIDFYLLSALCSSKHQPLLPFLINCDAVKEKKKDELKFWPANILLFQVREYLNILPAVFWTLDPSWVEVKSLSLVPTLCDLLRDCNSPSSSHPWDSSRQEQWLPFPSYVNRYSPWQSQISWEMYMHFTLS